MKSKVIIVGGGASVSEGIENDLWNKIKGQIIWSCNYAFMTMPYLPTRQLWVDKSFFKNNIIALNNLMNKGVEMIAKDNSYIKGLSNITLYEGRRNKLEYWGKAAKEKKKLFIGNQGFVGTFALHLAICENYEDIFLLGYDYGVPLDKIDEKKTHYYQDKLQVISSGIKRPEIYLNQDKTKVKPDVTDYNLFAKEKDVKIWNVSPQSNINCFEKITYEEFFKCLNG